MAAVRTLRKAEAPHEHPFAEPRAAGTNKSITPAQDISVLGVALHKQ